VLESGGYIVINQTEALVAIDINTGRFTGKKRLEETILKTNVEAVKEIVRQIRLRDLGGIIVVDFIDMEEKKSRQKVMAALEQELKKDRSPSKVISVNEFGLVILTRKRVRQSLERTLCEPCPYCSGSGMVKSVTTVCSEIYDEVRKLAPHFSGNAVSLRVNPDVARALRGDESAVLRELCAMLGHDVTSRATRSCTRSSSTSCRNDLAGVAASIPRWKNTCPPSRPTCARGAASSTSCPHATSRWPAPGTKRACPWPPCSWAWTAPSSRGERHFPRVLPAARGGAGRVRPRPEIGPPLPWRRSRSPKWSRCSPPFSISSRRCVRPAASPSSRPCARSARCRTCWRWRRGRTGNTCAPSCARSTTTSPRPS
jgi:hypothetical protein